MADSGVDIFQEIIKNHKNNFLIHILYTLGKHGKVLDFACYYPERHAVNMNMANQHLLY